MWKHLHCAFFLNVNLQKFNLNKQKRFLTAIFYRHISTIADMVTIWAITLILYGHQNGHWGPTVAPRIYIVAIPI